MKKKQSCKKLISTDLKVGFLLILSFFMFGAIAAAQTGDWRVSAANYARYYHFQETKADSASDRLQFDVNMGKFYAGAWFEVRHADTANHPIDSMTQRYFGWDDGGLNIHAGTFYQVFDRGLILNAYRDENVNVDNPLNGIRISGRYDYFDFDALSASNKASPDLKPIIRGAHAIVRPTGFFHLGGGYVSFMESYSLIGFTDIRSDLNEVNARVNYKYFDGYVEYARRNGYEIKDMIDSSVVKRRYGDGIYTNIALNYWNFSTFFEYKNYYRLIDNNVISGFKFNQPPAVNHQERSIQSQYPANGEIGWRLGLNYSPSIFWMASIDYAEAKSRGLDSTKYFMDEFYGELRGIFYKENQFVLSFDRLKHREQNEITPKLEVTYSFDEMNSAILTGSFIKYIIYGAQDSAASSPNYMEKYLSLEYSRSQTANLTIGGSWSDKKWGDIPDQDPSEMFYGELTLKFPNHDLSVFYGGQRGGYVCSGGVCTLRPTFRGLRVTLLSRF